MSSFVAGAYASLERASRSRQITDPEFHDRINFAIRGRRYRASLIVCPRQRGYGKQAQRGFMLALHPFFVRFVPLGRWKAV